MATTYRKHLESARRFALSDGVPEGIADSRLGKFESLIEANPRIAEQLEDVRLLAPACNRIALNAKFDATELEQRLAQTAELGYQTKVDVKLCLMHLGLVE